MNPDLRNLIALQDLELKITGLQKQVTDIPELVQGFDKELRRIREEHEALVARSKELVNHRRTLEGQADLSRSKLSRLKDQLMAVKTNKEYTAMLHEIKMAEDEIRAEEDRVLEIMEHMEALEAELKNRTGDLNKKVAELEAEIRKAENSVPGMETEMAKLREDQASMESLIESELLDRYRRIADARRGLGLAEAKDELCTACHVRIRPQVLADILHTGDIFICDSCSRILFSREVL